MAGMSSGDPRGSICRKWDLHIHTPGTKKNDQYSTDGGKDVWDEFCRKIEESDLQAFGIENLTHTLASHRGLVSANNGTVV